MATLKRNNHTLYSLCRDDMQVLTLFRIFFSAIVFIFATGRSLVAQYAPQYIYEGNKSFHKKDMQKAINKYTEALKIQPNNPKALYNLGNALYKEALTLKFSNQAAININNKDSIANLMLGRAADLYTTASQLYKHKDTLQRVYHNLGNAYLFQHKYNEAIDAYKKALKLNPNDEDTRYNLAFALKHKKDNQGGNNQQQNQQNQQNQQQQQQNQQQITKEQAERLMQTLIQKERELQSRKKEQPSGENAKPEKDW